MAKRPASIEYRKELKDRIITVAEELFTANGFKAVKMDDISGRLGISKRTLYEIYPNKEELIYETFKSSTEKDSEAFLEKIQVCTDTMDILTEFFRQRVRQMKNVNPCLYHELSTYPRVQAYIEEFKKAHSDSARKFYTKCQEEGYILPDVNFDLLHQLHRLTTDAFFGSDDYLKYQPDEILRTMVSLFIRSICTDKGIKRIDAMLAES